MTKEVVLSSSAKRQYGKLPAQTRARVKLALQALANDEDARLDIKRLHGVDGREPLYRLRVGDYRIIFKPDDGLIRVIRIIPRGKGYDWL